MLMCDMNTTDYAVLSAVKQLQERETFGAIEIAAACWGERKSVERSLRRLMAAGYLKRTGNPRRGYRYVVS